MHILHIDTEKTWRGGENQIRLLVEGLSAMGIENSIAAPPASELAKRMENTCCVFKTPLRGELNVNAAYKIARFCKENGVSIIDCQSSHAHSIGLMCKQFFLPSLKLVVHRRVDFPPKTGLVNRFKYLHQGIDRYIPISKAINDVLLQYGVSEDKTVTVPSAVDKKVYQSFERSSEKAKWCAKYSLDPQLPLIGQAAAMTEQKGYETLLNALSVLKGKSYDFHCLVAGDGPLRPSLEKLRVSLNLEGCLSFIGWIDEVPSFLSALDVFAMPSNFEGLGTAALDAIYAGCPVVASSVGGLKESIIDEHTGLLAGVKNSKEFAEQLERILKEPEFGRKLNRQAKHHCDRNFSLEAMVMGNLKVYQELLGLR
ncbi:MAG: glycosyltransferase family 4 protein [Oligoflexales bacterium]